MESIETIKINEIEYVKKSDVQQTIIKIDGGKSVATAAIGMKVIVRSRNEGINCGIVEAADESGVVLAGARRLWYHKPKIGAWYEGVSVSGIDADTKVSTTTIRKFILEDYSITQCTEAAFNSIMNKTPHNE